VNLREGQSDSATVLVVDDNEAVARSLTRVLQREGYHVATFYTGLEALTYAQTATPAAAVVDIHLPDISGLVLSSKLRDLLGPGRPIIILSGDTSMENLKTLRHVGATYFLPKPLNSIHLLDQLKALAAES
jgi:DNA-binding response OmpR family regulator